MDFYKTFKEEEAAIDQGLNSISATEQSQIRTLISTLTLRLSDLTSQVSERASELPSHDSKVYNEAIKTLRDRLASIQASSAPKAKFAFKNKRTAPTSTTSTDSTSNDDSVRTLHTPKYYDSARGNTGIITISDVSNGHVMLPVTLDTPLLPRQCIVKTIRNSIVDVRRVAERPDDAQPKLSSLTITSIASSMVLTLAVDGPVHITGAENSILALDCRQFRMHDCRNVVVHLSCTSRPIIEECADITFVLIALGPQSLTQEHVDPNSLIDDFSWLKSEPSPNWRMIKESELPQQMSAIRYVTEQLSPMSDEARKDILRKFDLSKD